MPYISVHIDKNDLHDLVDDVLEIMTDEQLRKELFAREQKARGGKVTDDYDQKLMLERAWRSMRGRDVPADLQDYFWEVLGKVAA